MFAVIFKAEVIEQSQLYADTVAKMRKLAFEKYGCIDFIALTEGNQEIAISYWPDQETIRQWKNDTEHCLAQSLGREQWYRSYSVQVVEVKREYHFSR